MAKTVLNDYNLTIKENAILNAIFLAVRYGNDIGVTAQGVANLISGRVGGYSVQPTRKALNTLKQMGYVKSFNVGRTSYWMLSELGADYVYRIKERGIFGNVARITMPMFEDEIPF